MLNQCKKSCWVGFWRQFDFIIDFSWVILLKRGSSSNKEHQYLMLNFDFFVITNIHFSKGSIHILKTLF